MSKIIEKAKEKIAIERAAMREDRERYLVPSWGLFFTLLIVGLLLSAVALGGGFDGINDADNSAGDSGRSRPGNVAVGGAE